MHMRAVLAFALALAPTFFASVSGAQDSPSAPAEAALTSDAVTHETIAQGTFPTLGGRWLVVEDLDLNGQNRGIAAFWEFRDDGGQLTLVERFVNLSEGLNAALEAKNAMAEKWEPTEQQLAEIKAGWATLPDQMRGVATVRNELWSEDAFIDEIKQEEATKDAQWVLRQTYAFAPGGNRPVRQVNIFGALEETPSGYRGNYSGVAVAVAPFPIPIPYKGTFRMYRLDPKPATGFLTWLGDMFKGCGR